MTKGHGAGTASEVKEGELVQHINIPSTKASVVDTAALLEKVEQMAAGYSDSEKKRTEAEKAAEARFEEIKKLLISASQTSGRQFETLGSETSSRVEVAERRINEVRSDVEAIKKEGTATWAHRWDTKIKKSWVGKNILKPVALGFDTVGKPVIVGYVLYRGGKVLYGFARGGAEGAVEELLD